MNELLRSYLWEKLFRFTQPSVEKIISKYNSGWKDHAAREKLREKMSLTEIIAAAATGKISAEDVLKLCNVTELAQINPELSIPIIKLMTEKYFNSRKLLYLLNVTREITQPVDVNQNMIGWLPLITQSIEQCDKSFLDSKRVEDFYAKFIFPEATQLLIELALNQHQLHGEILSEVAGEYLRTEFEEKGGEYWLMMRLFNDGSYEYYHQLKSDVYRVYKHMEVYEGVFSIALGARKALTRIAAQASLLEAEITDFLSNNPLPEPKTFTCYDSRREYFGEEPKPDMAV